MTVSSINPFALGNTARAYGASTYTPASLTATKPVDSNLKAKGFSGFASTEDIERAAQYLEGNINPFSSVQKTRENREVETKGAAWEGFSVPNNNGTGELIPQYFEGEKIYDYMA